MSAGAGFAAGTVVGGGGVQPEDVLPDSVVVFADVDLDPSAEQKVNLVRLLGQFPDVEEDYGDRPDLRELIVDQLVEGTELEDANALEWVGDRVGVGLSWDPEAGSLTPVAAIQTTDEQAAVSDLELVLEPDEVAVTQGYVVIAGDAFEDFRDPAVAGDELVGDPLTAAEIVSAGESAPLADSPQFVEVFDRLDSGVMTFFFDGQGLASAFGEALEGLGLTAMELGVAPGDLEAMEELGQSGAVLRAEPTALELLAWSNAVPYTSTDPVSLVGSLPDSTLLAVEWTGGAQVVQDEWAQSLEDMESGGLTNDQIEGVFAELEAQLDLRLPEDLETLVGEDVVITVDAEGLLTGIPGIGLRSVTDPQAGADLADRIQSALSSLTGGFGITATGTEDGMVVASSEEFADELVSGDGSLGSQPGFQEAVPDADQAAMVMWLDFAAISGFAQLASPESADVISPLQSLGIAVTPEEGGTQVRARLVFEGSDDT